MRELEALELGQVALLGVPWDVHSSFLRGPALAPRQIRAAVHNGAMNLCAENGLDLGGDRRWRDLGDLAIPAGDEAALAAITGAAAAVLRPAVLWRRGCYGTQSAAGSRFVERMLTVSATCQQHQRPLLPYLVEAVVAHWTGQSAPKLLLSATP